MMVMFAVREAKVVRRSYAAHPLFIHRRLSWELVAVVEGAIRPEFPDRPASACASQVLWLLAPDTACGWAAEHDPCTVAVASFDDLPDALKQQAGPQGWCAWQLQDGDCQRLRHLVGSLAEDLRRPRLHNTTRGNHLAWEFAVLGLDRERLPQPATPTSRAAATVAQALDWFQEHLADCPTLADMAARVGVSATHLRRLFHQVHGHGPRGAMDHIRMTIAEGMLMGTTHSIDEIARACGYRSTTAFARAYRRSHHIAPGQQRGRLRTMLRE